MRRPSKGLKGSPKDDDREGGGTDGYVSSCGLTVPANGTTRGLSEEGGVVKVVVALIPVPLVGENGDGEEREAEAEEGGVVDALGGAFMFGWGRRICDGGRGMGTRAETIVTGWECWALTGIREGEEEADELCESLRRWRGCEYGSVAEGTRPIKLSTGRPSLTTTSAKVEWKCGGST